MVNLKKLFEKIKKKFLNIFKKKKKFLNIFKKKEKFNPDDNYPLW